MPNRAGRQAVKDRKNTETENGDTTVSAPAYDIASIGSLGDSFTFKRSGAGRKREPSPFDELVEQWVGTGTRFLPVADEETGEKAIADLQKACSWNRGRENFNGYGLSKRLTTLREEDGVPATGLYVVFEVKAEKERRERKAKTAETAPSPEAQDAATTE
jgi:hypothetical protein